MPSPSGDVAYVYRVLWEAYIGPLTPDVLLHHTCHDKSCINLDHLTPMSRADHIREHGFTGDWGQADKTHCANGHPYDETNTYTYITKDGSTERHCRTCRLAAKRRYNDKHRRR